MVGLTKRMPIRGKKVAPNFDNKFGSNSFTFEQFFLQKLAVALAVLPIWAIGTEITVPFIDTSNTEYDKGCTANYDETKNLILNCRPSIWASPAQNIRAELCDKTFAANSLQSTDIHMLKLAVMHGMLLLCIVGSAMTVPLTNTSDKCITVGVQLIMMSQKRITSKMYALPYGSQSEQNIRAKFSNNLSGTNSFAVDWLPSVKAYSVSW